MLSTQVLLVVGVVFGGMSVELFEGQVCGGITVELRPRPKRRSLGVTSVPLMSTVKGRKPSAVVLLVIWAKA